MFISKLFGQTVRRLSTERSLNKVTLIGRVGGDAQIKGTVDTPVVQFSLATSNYSPVSDNLTKTEWHKVAVFKPGLRRLAEKYIKSGARVYLEGRIAYGFVKTAQNQDLPMTSIIADDIVFLSKTGLSRDEYDEKDYLEEEAKSN